MFAHGETVTVQTAGTVADPYSGENSEDWGTPTSVVVTGVGVEPRPSGEPLQDARNQVVSGFTLYFPPGAPVTSTSRVVVRGDTYEVLGEPAVWVNPFTGWAPGVLVQVERTVG